MAVKVNEYNILFQEDTDLRSLPNAEKRRKNVRKCQRQPLLLPQLQSTKTASKNGDRMPDMEDMELDIRGLGKTTDFVFLDAGIKNMVKQSRKRKTREPTFGFSATEHKDMQDRQKSVFSLPPIDSKPLTSTSLSPEEENTAMSKEISMIYHFLARTIENVKVEQKVNSKRFQRNIVHGEKKQIIEKQNMTET